MNHELSQEKYFGQYDTEYFGNKAGAASMAFLNSAGRVTWVPNFGCHGIFTHRWKPGGHCALYSSLRCRYEDLFPAALAYWDYILSPERSPWRRALKGREIVLNKSHGRPIAVGLHDMDAPTQLALGCIIQCRVPQENSHKLRSFWFWRKSGFTEWESLYLSELFFLHTNGALSEITQGYTHGFEKDSEINPLRIRDASFNAEFLTRGPLKKCCQYTPLGALWSEGAPMKVAEVVALLKGTPTYTGVFPQLFKSAKGDLGHGLVSKEQAVDILMKNRSKWSGQ